MEIAVERPGTARRGTRLGRVVSSVLLIAVLLLSVAYLLPSLLGYQRYIITGGSMTGTYDKGSIVFEKLVPRDDLRVGDVITYVPPASSGVTNLVTHRIVHERTGEDGWRVFRTRGDANPSRDPWTFSLDEAEQPVVAFAVPHAGWVFLFLHDPRHRMWLIGGPAALIALVSLVEAFRNARRTPPSAPASAGERPLVSV